MTNNIEIPIFKIQNYRFHWVLSILFFAIGIYLEFVFCVLEFHSNTLLSINRYNAKPLKLKLIVAPP